MEAGGRAEGLMGRRWDIRGAAAPWFCALHS